MAISSGCCSSIFLTSPLFKAKLPINRLGNGLATPLDTSPLCGPHHDMDGMDETHTSWWGPRSTDHQPLAAVRGSSQSVSNCLAHANLRTMVSVPNAASKQATTGNRQPRGITKPKPISPAMKELLGVPEIPRTQALKQIWAYIKQHNLQDPENKKIIVCNEKLKKIFGGRDRVGFLEISGLLNPHFMK